MIVLDTSVLVDALTGERRSAPALRDAIARGERIVLTTIVLYEWLRGPRNVRELEAQEALFPAESALPFGPAEARRSAEIYQTLARPQGREVDIAIAACAACAGASVWTLNPGDFEDCGIEVVAP